MENCVFCGIKETENSMLSGFSYNQSLNEKYDQIIKRVCWNCIQDHNSNRTGIFGNLLDKYCVVCGGKCKSTEWVYTIRASMNETLQMNPVKIYFLTCSKECYNKKLYDINGTILATEKNLERYKFCNRCNKFAVDIKMCSKCKNVYYCDKICQKEDWPKHKKSCVQNF